MRLSIGYPGRDQEILMAEQYLSGKTPDTIDPVCSSDDVLEMKKAVAKIQVNQLVLGYIQEIIGLTREEKRFVLGASPRAMLALTRASQAKAYLQGRDYVKPDDVKEMAQPVLLHRLSLTSEAKIQREDPQKILHALILKAKIPVNTTN